MIDGCSYEYVALYDGMNDISTRLDQLCGLQFPVDMLSTGRYMFVQFTSDADVVGAGFNLTYEFRSPVGKMNYYMIKSDYLVLMSLCL